MSSFAQKLCVKAIENGEILIYPTETLYAVGGNALSEDVIAKVQLAKNRPADKAFPLIVGNIATLKKVTELESSFFLKLREYFWPGPLSIAVPCKENIPRGVQDADGYCIVRWSSHPVAAELSALSGCPLIASSANLSGEVAPKKLEEINPFLREKIPYIYGDAPYAYGDNPSTIIRMNLDESISILRQGPIDEKMLQKHFTVRESS